MEGVIHAAQTENARVVYADNLYMYGQTQSKLSESLPNRATGRKGVTRARMAETLMDAHNKGKVKAVIGRAPDFTVQEFWILLWENVSLELSLMVSLQRC